MNGQSIHRILTMTLYIYKDDPALRNRNVIRFPKSYDEPLAGIEQLRSLALSVAAPEDMYVIQNGFTHVECGFVKNLVAST